MTNLREKDLSQSSENAFLYSVHNNLRVVNQTPERHG